MALTPEDVGRIAHLARLELQPAEQAAMLKQLNAFFSIVEQMGAVDTRGVEPLYTPLSAVSEVTLRLARRRGDRNRSARTEPAQRAGRCRRPVPGAEGRRMSGDLHDLGVSELSAALGARRVSSDEVTRHLLERVGAHQALGAWLCVDEAAAVERARAADAARAGGDTRPLLGVPLAHKDIFVTRDLPTTAGSKMLSGYRSPFDATVVARLSDGRHGHAGQAQLRRVRHGFGQRELGVRRGAQTPGDVSRVPGGSSGGSATAVAARLIPAATGTDTGGSIRQPASFTGITGIKPTYGVCSRFGMIAFASSLDQAGPMARSAEDCAMLLSAMSGFDERDATSAQRPPQDYVARHAACAARGLGEPATQGPAHRLAHRILPRRAERWRRGRGAVCAGRVRAPGRPADRGQPAAHRVVDSRSTTSSRQPRRAPTSAASTGCVFGHRAAKYTDLLDMYKKSRAEGFGDEVKRRIMIGSYVLSHGYYDAYYLQAPKAAPHDCRRFPGLLRAVRRDRRACGADGGLVARRQGRRPGGQLPSPTSSPCRRAWPGCPA